VRTLLLLSIVLWVVHLLLSRPRPLFMLRTYLTPSRAVGITQTTYFCVIYIEV
jgi:hypothetical protein